MGKTKKRYLVNRILAMILVAAMSVTMVPQTALAAPADDSAVAGIANDVAAEGSGDADANQGIGSDDADTNDDTDGDEANANNGAGGDADVNNGTDGEKTEVKANDTPAAKPKYEIAISDEFVSKAEYSGSEHFTDITSGMALYKDGEEVTDPDEAAKITCAWKVKGVDGNYGAMTGTPKDAGSYQAVLTYPAAEGVHDGAEKTVDCEITKAPVTITLERAGLTVKPGTKMSNVAVPAINSVSGGTDGSLAEIDPENLTLSMKIKDAVTGVEITAADAVLTKDGDYAMELTPAYKADLDATKKAGFEKNFDLKPFTADIVMAELIETRLFATPNDTYKQEGETTATQITKEYSGEAVVIEAGADKDYTVKVQYEDTDGSWQDLTGDDVKTAGEWDSYTGCEVAADGKVQAPKDAGSYSYSVVYAGKDGVYAESRASFPVVITPVELTIEPAVTTLTVAEGMTMSEVLAKVDYKVLDKNGADVKETVKAKHIWGTSYYGTGTSQIYEPVFTLQESTDNGASWDDIAKNRIYTLNKDSKYRITYTGRKAIFEADGSNGYYDVIDDINADEDDSSYTINGVDKNYHTSTTLAAGKEVAVTVTPGTKAVIDAAVMMGDGKGQDTIKALKPKQYDGDRIFATRSAYKNKVKLTADGKEVPTEQREFTYTWYEYNGDDRIDAVIAEKNGPIPSYDWIRQDSSFISPKDAGVYRLVISYEDKINSAEYYYADDVILYFAIDPRQVTITPKAESYEILEGRSMWDFFHGEKAIEYEVKAVEGTLPQENVVGSGMIVETVKATAETPAAEHPYYPDDTTAYFQKEEAASYVLQGNEPMLYDSEGDYYYNASNYTCTKAEYVEVTNTRTDTPLNTVSKPVTVTPLGETQVEITVDLTKWETMTKIYDAKSFAAVAKMAEELVSVKKKADGTDVTSELKKQLRYVVPYMGDDRELKDIVDVGTYDLYVRFDGSKDYAPCGWDDTKGYPDKLGVKLGTFKITKKEISLTADLEKSYPAGTSVDAILEEVSRRYQVNGYVHGQESAFEDRSGGDNALPAWDYSGPYFYVTEKGSNTPVGAQLKRNKTYEVKYDNTCGLIYDTFWDATNQVEFIPADDYKVKNEPVAEFTTKPGNSEIKSVYYSGIPSSAIQVQNDKTDPLKREVTMTEAIEWSSVYLDGKQREGNFAAFLITAPAEYDETCYGSLPDTAMYENSIKAAGGYVVDTSSYDDESCREGFIAVFDANAKAENPKFDIRWEDGYVETYTLNFKDAAKLANLEDAVAPKALAFNAPDKKMAVGKGQQLDVKITKEQMGDIIYLGYESETPDTLAVNQSGYVTALKMGPGKITVFAQHRVNGKTEPIRDAKGKYAKSATLQIQVTKLDAPKKAKVTAHGSYVELNYDSPAYGYRREIYVLEGKQQQTVFEQKLADMKKNQWKEQGFVIEPVYLDKWDENNSRSSYGYVERLTGLKIRKDYTIYVRNVCAVRTLNSNYGKGAVTQAAMTESAAGVTVSVKTKKAEVNALSLDFYDPQTLKYAWKDDHVFKFSELKNGTIECRTEGTFPELYTGDEIKSNDGIQLALPLAGNNKNNYEEPKLEYALADCYDKKTGTRGWGTKNDYASIDKKGKIKITGLPSEDSGTCRFEVRVRDTVTGKAEADCFFLVFEAADSVKAAKGSVALSVGQTQDLNDLLSYNLGRTKLTAYPHRWIDVAKVRKAIEDQNQKDYFTVDDGGTLTAIKGGGKLKNLELTDKNVEKLSGTEKATAKVTITSKAQELVKGIKTYDVTHNKFGLTFTYAGYANDFLFEVYDAKGRMLYSRILSKGWSDEDGNWNEGYGINALLATDKDGKFIEVKDAEGNGQGYWTEVKNTYQIDSFFIRDQLDLGNMLARESQYTVSLTPVWNGTRADKATTAKVKTTKIPVMDGHLEYNDVNFDYDGDVTGTWGCDRKGGMSITVSEGSQRLHVDRDEDGDVTSSQTRLDIVSGNTYTLTANVQYNRGRVNDTLVWSVGDAKVATVKAAAGTYCITLKGVKPGNTKLEVRSKLLGNKVIARYDIYVNSVGNAYNNESFYGENEPE